MNEETETLHARAMRLFGDENLNEAIDSAEREMADLRASLKQAATAYEGRCNMLMERCAAAEKEAEFQRTRANELAGDRDRASAFAARLQDMLAKTQKDFADVTACLAEMSGGRVTHYDFMQRGRGEDHVQQLLAVVRGGVKQDKAEWHSALDRAEAKAAELRQAVREAADFLGVLARVHEVFDNLQPGCAGRLGGAWRLYEAGWRADQTVEEAHRLLGRRMGERMAHPDPIVCALIEATKSQWTGPDAVKALAPLALVASPTPDEALVANLERAMADRDKYREALLAAGMNADELEPIKWGKAHAQETSDNEAIVRMLGITAWEAGPAMEPDSVATLVELFQSSMPPDFMFGANRENPTAVVWSWQTDVCGQGFATPLLALEDAWIRHCALVEAKARKEADRAAADQHSTLHRGVDLAKDGASDSTVVTARHGAGGWKIEGPVPAKAPGWTGITWTSRKGKAKSVSVPGMVLASGIAEGTSGPFTSVDIPEGVAHLPMDLLRRVRYGGLLTFHMGDLKRTGIISGVDRATRYDRLRIEIAES